MRILMLSIVVTLVMVSCTGYRHSVISEDGVYYYQRVELGGIKQSVMIRGKSLANPVMLFLHGGPGFPLFPIDQTSRVMQELEEDFTMVYWEQRGTGGSFSWRLARKSLTVDDFVDDTYELVNFIREVLGVDKVYLWGHSWGSSIGAIFSSRYPELLHAYISTGQSVNPFKNERLCYEFVLEKATRDNDKRALRQLERVDTLHHNYSLRDALLVRSWVYKYGGVIMEPGGAGYIDLQTIVANLKSPEYGLLDRINMVLMPYFSAEELWSDLKELDIRDHAPRIDVPVYFLLGRFDIIVSSSLAEEYFHDLEAPAGKQLVWFDESAHRPHHEEMEKFLEVIRTMVLPCE